MPNFNSLKLDTLRERCRTAGLPTSGERREFIERLNRRYNEDQFESYQEVPESSLAHRIQLLEKALEDVRKSKMLSTTMSSSKQSVVLDDEIQQSNSQLRTTNGTTHVSAKSVTFSVGAQNEQQQLSLSEENPLNLNISKEQAYTRPFSQPTPVSATIRNMQLQQFSQTTPILATTGNMHSPSLETTCNMPRQQFSQPTPILATKRNMSLQQFNQPTPISETTGICNFPYQQTARYTTPQHEP